jgi:uncharacterized protein
MPEAALRVRETGNSVEVALHVQPRARRTEIAGEFNGALKLKVMAPPVDEAANRAVIQFFASILAVPKSRVQIVSGDKSREKILRIEGISLNDFLARLPGGRD